MCSIAIVSSSSIATRKFEAFHELQRASILKCTFGLYENINIRLSALQICIIVGACHEMEHSQTIRMGREFVSKAATKVGSRSSPGGQRREHDEWACPWTMGGMGGGGGLLRWAATTRMRGVGHPTAVRARAHVITIVSLDSSGRCPTSRPSCSSVGVSPAWFGRSSASEGTIRLSFGFLPAR